MRWPLRTQILLLFAGLIIVTVLGLTSLHAWFTAERVSDEIGRKVDQVARTLSSSTFPWSPAILDQMSGLSGAHFAVVDADERILASSADFQKLPLGRACRAGRNGGRFGIRSSKWMTAKCTPLR